MATSLDMSLDDIIKSKKNVERDQGRNRGRGRGRGASFGRGRFDGRGGPLGVKTKSSSSTIAKSFSRARDLAWQHSLFNDSMLAARLTAPETDTKLYVSNLDMGVSNEDIKELFSEVGQLKRYSIHYDRNGRSTGSAEVVFARKNDAFAALKKYNNVQLDGKPMKIEVIGTNLGVPISARVNVVGGGNGRGKRTVVMTPDFSQIGAASFNRDVGGRGRGAFRRGRGRGRGQGGNQHRGRGRRQPSERFADDLDKDLDKYHAEAMNIS